MKCGECGRTFDLADEAEADEFYNGHDCEAPRLDDRFETMLLEARRAVWDINMSRPGSDRDLRGNARLERLLAEAERRGFAPTFVKAVTATSVRSGDRRP